MTPSAVARKRAIERPVKRVQGIKSDIGDLVLRDGTELRVKIGGAILPTPTLKRGMGNSSVELSVHDPRLRWLKLGMASERWDAKIDGLWFRYLGTSKSGKTLTLRFEDRDVARLRELTGPKRVLAHRGKPNEVTRAEFILSLVEELRPKPPVFIPQLRERQPIETAREGTKAKEDADADRGRGIGDVEGLTVKGVKATPEQIDIGDRALRVCESLGAPTAVSVATIASLAVESLLGKVDRNYMQMIPSVAAASQYSPTVIEEAVTGFLKGYVPGHEGALAYYRSHPGAKPHEIAQGVQKSRAGLASNGAGNYGPWVEEAREWVEAFDGGGGGGGSREVIEPFEFTVGKKESYWAAIQRLAQEVNWRAFFLAGRFFFISEDELIRSKVRLAIKLDDEAEWHPAGIEDVDFDYNENKPITQATVSAFVKGWGVPPGAVVTLEGAGPASIGFGSPPVKPDSKGVKRGISNNRKASTGEGRGRYLVSSIEVPLTGDAEARLATIEIRKPTAPRPEPANERTSRSSTGGRAAGSTGGMGVLEGTPEDIVNQVVEYANSNGFPNVTPDSVRAANATHGPTISGSTSDHQGPPNVAWAADISNGTSPTQEMDRLARAIAEAFNIQWSGAGLVNHEAGGYRMQLIYRTSEGGNHFNHVHFGVRVA